MRDDAAAAALSFDDVLKARASARGVVARTPARLAPKLAALTGAASVRLKLENLHYTGSFKERGVVNALSLLSPERAARGVVAASAGNHAQALAYHAQRLNISAVIVMPEATPAVKVEGTRRFGARVVLAGEVFDEAMTEARRIEAEEGRALVHAFDDPAVIAGQATATLELLEDGPEIELIVVPVGGGGLIAGALLAAEGAQAAGGPKTEIIGVETAMYPSLRKALSGEALEVGGDTIAEGIAVKAIGPAPMSVVAPRLGADDVMLVGEGAIEEAIVTLAMVEKTIAEGAGAAGLAALFEHPARFRGRHVGVMVCGGNIDASLFAQVLNRHLVRSKRRARVRVECLDRPGRLAEITNTLRAAGANVIDVAHDRLALDVPAKDTVIDVILETDDAASTLAVIERLRAAGFPRARIIEGHR